MGWGGVPSLLSGGGVSSTVPSLCCSIKYTLLFIGTSRCFGELADLFRMNYEKNIVLFCVLFCLLCPQDKGKVEEELTS